MTRSNRSGQAAFIDLLRETKQTQNRHTHTRLTALFRDYQGEPVPERQHQSGFYCLTEARDSEWQWHQLGHMQVCT